MEGISKNMSPDYYDANQQQEEQEEDSSNRMKSKKSSRVRKPKGKSVLIKTPTNNTSDEYNVHSRFEDEENETPPSYSGDSSNPSSATKSKNNLRTALTPRSASKFKFVHAHP